MVAGPTVDAGLDKPGPGQHSQERPPPHGPGDSVQPLALVRHLLRHHAVVQEDVGHLEPTAGPQHPERLGQHGGLVGAEVKLRKVTRPSKSSPDGSRH